MIYLVTLEQKLFENPEYKTISVEESLQLMKDCKVLQYDSETTGRDARICNILCVQFGNKEKDFQIVVDCTTIDITLYKDILEGTLLIGQNLKFDLQFLYNHGIVPRNVYDTMIVEQLLYLGYPAGIISFSLAAIAQRRLGIDIDKSIRGQIIWRGLDTQVIIYAANDVKWLEDIMWSQVADCKKKDCLKGAKLECNFVPVISYLEWCGIKLDEKKWKAKMEKDKTNLLKAKEALDKWLVDICLSKPMKVEEDHSIEYIGYMPYNDEEYNNYKINKERLERAGYILIDKNVSEMGGWLFTYKSPYKISTIVDLKDKFITVNLQGNLFEGFDTTPKANINWSSSKQVIQIAKAIGFNTTVQDKKTKEDKDSVLEKHLKGQKGINDEFLKLYFDYQEHAKVVSSFGQSQLNMINPRTGRCHTVYKQLGASSGRMSCGSQQPNEDLAKLKKIRPKECTYCNFQQLPADDDTRGSFVSEKDNIFCSCDYSAMESYLGADIYEDIEFQNEFLYGSKDTHSLFAWMVFRKECEALGCTCVADVKKKAPQWRKAVKAVEFAYMFGAAAPTIAQSANCSVEQAQEYIDRLDKGFTGISRFAREGSKFVRKNGYVLINKYTGHKMYWWDHDKWLERQKSFTSEFWDEYKAYHKGTTSRVALEVREHFQAASKWDRMARNAPTQGSGACITKLACTNFFNWIIDNGLFDKVKIVAIVHDEVCIEYPKELKDTYKMLEYHMEEASKAYCKFSKIPAKAEVGNHWIH